MYYLLFVKASNNLPVFVWPVIAYSLADVVDYITTIVCYTCISVVFHTSTVMTCLSTLIFSVSMFDSLDVLIGLSLLGLS